MNIVLLGPPGAGKGTQASNLVNDFNLYKVSTGDLLRKEINIATTLGNKIKLIIDQGKLVSDIIINDLIKKVLLDKKINNRLIFDGYPRNLNQAKELDLLVKNNNQKVSCALSLDVDMESINVSDPENPKFENVIGRSNKAEAKIAGITPAVFIFNGKCDDSPP